MVTVNNGFNRPVYILFKKEGTFLITDAPLANWQGKEERMGYINVFQRTANKKKGRGGERKREGGREEEEEEEEKGGRRKKKKEPERIRN